MSAKKSALKKRFFSVPDANAALPLVRAIVQDIVTLAADLRERKERLAKSQSSERTKASRVYVEEFERAEEDFERDRDRLLEYEQELRELGVELKDYFEGLVDFPCRLYGREAYLCWKLGEAEVEHWHDLGAGFAGRQRLSARSMRAYD